MSRVVGFPPHSLNLLSSSSCPQVGPGFNRDYWARFEKLVKDAAKVADGVYIVTGPLWLPQPDARGKWEMRHPMIGETQKHMQCQDAA